MSRVLASLPSGLPPVIATAPELAPDVGPLRPVRVAIVGLGRMGVAHAAVLSMLRGADVAAVVDSQRAAGRRLRGMGFRMPLWPSVDAMLDGTRVDAVWVCTPPDAHLAVVRRCLAGRVAVFVEKPLAHTLADARALCDLAAEGGRPVACGYTLAFWPSFVAARRLLEAGVVGPPERVEASMVLSQVSGGRRARGWMYDRRRAGGGVLSNLGSHLLFVLRACFGMPARVRATTRQVYTAVDDEVSAVLEVPGGPEIAFASSWCVTGHPVSRTTMTVAGPVGTLRVDDDGLVVEVREPRCGLAAGVTALRAADLPQPAAFALNGEAYALEDAHVLHWVTGGPPPPITAAAGLEVQRLMDALYASAAAGGATVDVPA